MGFHNCKLAKKHNDGLDKTRVYQYIVYTNFGSLETGRAAGSYDVMASRGIYVWMYVAIFLYVTNQSK